MGNRDHGPFSAIYWLVPGEHDYMIVACYSRAYESKVKGAVRTELSHVTFHGSGIRYFHARWQEQKEQGGLYYAVVSQSEIDELVAGAKMRSAARRRSEEETFDRYTKRVPLPIEKLPDRIRSKIRIGDSGCWLWQGQIDRNGYGILSDRNTKTVKAHREVFEWLCGRIPNPLQLRHSCHVRNCVNPYHLTPGTAKQNNQDKVERRRLYGNNT